MILVCFFLFLETKNMTFVIYNEPIFSLSLYPSGFPIVYIHSKLKCLTVF
jgi:hypothetical protein